ncbi:MAG: hypothetical protein E7241_00155 [Lachnospiraceae bacterium]|nr:hypothetical protein [Lachnospiraceae bacterium]
MLKEKYALLDTDFISKTHLIRKDNQNTMIDRILDLPGYQFFCHEQIQREISRHDAVESNEWLNKKIAEERIHCLSDEDILDELHGIYSDSAEAMYTNMLKNGCEAFRKDYLETSFPGLTNIDFTNTSKETFLQVLSKDCANIGEGNNLGEIKSYVLFQMLSVKYGEQVYVFCSDDKDARKGIISLGGVRCISVVSAFPRLIKDGGMSEEEIRPYIQSFLEERQKNNQTTIKVHENSKEGRMKKVSCEKVMEELLEGKLETLMNGNLRYNCKNNKMEGT